MQLAAVDSVSGISGYCACCYAGNLAVLINGNLIVNLNIAAVHNDGGSAVGNLVAGYVDICQFSTLISIYAIFGCNVAGGFDSTVSTADVYIFAGQIAKHDILVQVNLINFLTVKIGFFNVDVAAVYNLTVFACFGCYCMQLAAVYSISGISGYCACCYTGNLAVFSNSYFTKLSTFSGDLAVVAACIAYKQLTVTQCGMTGIYAVLQNYVADFACGCSYFAVFIYGEVVVCTIECTVAVYEERHNTVFICSTYGQVVFCVQCVGLDGVYTGNVAFFIDGYLTKFSGFRSDLAVVAVCIAYEQFCVTQCGVTGIYAILQYYVADFACGCDYFTVFIYGEVVVCTIECTVAVYEERHNTVFICSTYGQVVFCVQGVGLNIVYLNVFVQLNLNLSAVMAYADVLVAAEINEIAGFYIGCFGCYTVGSQVPAHVCSCAYCLQLAYVYSISISSTCSYAMNLAVFSNSYFAQLSAFSGDLAVIAICIAYKQLTVTQCGMAGEYAIVQNYVACGYIAVFIYYEAAVCTIECAVAVYEERYSAVFICSTYGQVVFCVQCVGLDGVYTGNVAFFIDSYLTEFSGFRSDLAVVAACIAYEQLAITQCGITGVYAIVQNYVACGYIAVFIYYEAAVCTIECAVAVYEERYSAVFICSTYGQVVFCIQGVGLNCVGLDGVYIDIFVQLNLNFSAVMAYADVLVAAEVNNFVGSYIGCFGCNTVGGKIPAFICICSYLFDFFQLAYIYSISIINAFSYVSDYFIVSIQAIFGDISIAAKTNTTLSTKEVVACIYLVNFQIFVQLNLNGCNAIFVIFAYGNIFFVTGKVNNTIIFNLAQATCYSTISSKLPAAFCYSAVQLAYIYSIGISYACCYVGNYFTVSIQTAFGDVSFAAKTNATLTTHEVIAGIYAVNIKISVQVNLNKGSILVFFLAYGNIFIATAEVNSSTGFNISRAGDCILGGKIPAFVCICSNLFYLFQLAYVYCIGIISTFCNIGNLTFSVSAAYGYCISSVSYAANAQSNTTFSRYRSTVADSNCIIRCNCILITEGNNIAYASDCVLVAHYKGIGNIVQSIVGACHEYVMVALFCITDKLVIIADNGRISLFGNSVGTADYCYSTAFFSSKNRIVTEQNSKAFACANIHIFIGIGNLIARTLNGDTIRCFDSICSTHNIVSYAGINFTVFIIYSIFRAHNSCRCTLNIYRFLNRTNKRNIYFSYIRSSVTVNNRISTYNSSVQATGICISTYQGSTFTTADSVGA